MKQRGLDTKLQRIRAGEYRSTDFLLADAKDGEMGGGVHAAGPQYDPDSGDQIGFKPYLAYQQAMRDMTGTGLVDIMLMAASSAERLHDEKLFDGSPVTPAVRLNDATDIWGFRGASYKAHPSRPFRTANLQKVRRIADLGLYSVTFYNDLAIDVPALEAYGEFRAEAAAADMRHFLEVFAPAFDIDTGEARLADYMNDSIVRCLAGVLSDEMPLFLKMPFLGAQAMEELSAYDPGRIVVGILGGSGGTTRDAFELISQGERHGARVALFGRKINLAEDPVTLVGMMRRVIERDLDPREAVRAYHGELSKKGLRPIRQVDDDNIVTESVLKAEAQS